MLGGSGGRGSSYLMAWSSWGFMKTPWSLESGEGVWSNQGWGGDLVLYPPPPRPFAWLTTLGHQSHFCVCSFSQLGANRVRASRSGYTTGSDIQCVHFYIYVHVCNVLGYWKGPLKSPHHFHITLSISPDKGLVSSLWGVLHGSLLSAVARSRELKIKSILMVFCCELWVFPGIEHLSFEGLVWTEAYISTCWNSGLGWGQGKESVREVAEVGISSGSILNPQD